MMARLVPASPGGRRIVTLSFTLSLVLAGLIIARDDGRPPRARAAAQPLAPRPLPADGGGDRPLFLDPPGPALAALPPDAPILAGIAGRLGRDAVAMVRDTDGATRIVVIGQAYQGWRLDAISADAALFTRGAQRLRVPLSATDDAEVAQPAQ